MKERKVEIILMWQVNHNRNDKKFQKKSTVNSMKIKYSWLHYTSIKEKIVHEILLYTL